MPIRYFITSELKWKMRVSSLETLILHKKIFLTTSDLLDIRSFHSTLPTVCLVWILLPFSRKGIVKFLIFFQDLYFLHTSVVKLEKNSKSRKASAKE